MQSTSWEMLGWKKHKLESRLPGETLNKQMKMINKSSRQQQARFWRIIKLHEGWRMQLAGRPPRVAGEGEWAGISASSFLQFSLVALVSPTPCDPMDCSTPGLPDHHQFPNSCPLSQWYHPNISSSVIPFSSCFQSFPASGSSPRSQFFTSDGQSIGVSASTSVLPMNTQDWSTFRWTGWISLQSKGLSRVFSNTTVQKHQFFCTQLSL